MIVDLSFPLAGTSVPLDHGYPLYAAITSHLPGLHRSPWLGIHPIGGRAASGVILLGRSSALRLRMPAEHISDVLGLAGVRLDVAGSSVGLGAPVVRALTPRPALDARLVLLKLTRPPMRANPELGRDVLDNDGFAERYRTELQRQLEALEVSAALQLCGRRSITIHGRRLFGYSVRLTGLSEEDSLLVQARGLGGRRGLGCGVFRPTRGLQ
jgi:Cas6 Crispr